MLSVDPVLYSKIVRLMRTFFKEYKSSNDKESLKPIFATLLSILEDVLFPTVTLLDCCVVQSEEIWQILKNLDYELRYRLYGYWKNASYKLHPRLILSQACFQTLVLLRNDYVITHNENHKRQKVLTEQNIFWSVLQKIRWNSLAVNLEKFLIQILVHYSTRFSFKYNDTIILLVL